VEAYRVVRCRGSHIARQSTHIWRLDFQPYMSAALYPTKSFGTHFYYRYVPQDSMATVTDA
jgi:hypothetical protein